MKSFGAALAWLAPALIAALLLALRIAAVWPDPQTVWASGTRRFWEDTQLATGYFLKHEFPVYCNDVVKGRAADGIVYQERYPQVSRSVEEAGVKTWQFWRTVSSRRFLRRTEATVSTRFDDSGRPFLLGLAFRAMGGISPFLILWIAFVLLVPLLAWIAWEFHARGLLRVGSVFLLFTGLSAYVADNLALPYSPSGFYVVSLYALVALSAYATAPDDRLGRGHWLRVLGAGLAFGLCALGRGGTLLQIGGFILAIAIAVFRRTADEGKGRRERVVSLILSVALFALPYLAARLFMDRLIAQTLERYGESRVPQQHAFWFGVWSGLGDFDEKKGHVWSDFATWDAIVKAGGTPVTPTYYDPANETVLRRVILGEIGEDPIWYAQILVRRTWATLAQPKLWPWPPLGGASIAPSTRPNEGALDSYYTLTATADRFAVGQAVFEAPVPLLFLPSVVLLFVCWRRRRFSDALPLLPLLAALLPLPVLVTTASALEPQAIVVAYMLGAALLTQSLRPAPHSNAIPSMVTP